jgi:hypothetical protein
MSRGKRHSCVDAAAYGIVEAARGDNRFDVDRVKVIRNLVRADQGALGLLDDFPEWASGDSVENWPDGARDCQLDYTSAENELIRGVLVFHQTLQRTIADLAETWAFAIGGCTIELPAPEDEQELEAS